MILNKHAAVLLSAAQFLDLVQRYVPMPVPAAIARYSSAAGRSLSGLARNCQHCCSICDQHQAYIPLLSGFVCLQTADYDTMARALATIGVCDDNVDYVAFSRDLEAFFTELEQVNTNLVVSRDQMGGERAGWAGVKDENAENCLNVHTPNQQ